MTAHKLLSNIHVLIVDDTPLVVAMLTALLNSLGIGKITSAHSVDSALEKFPRLGPCPFDIIFLDRYLGQESGLDVLRTVREQNKALPIVMLTQEDGSSKVIEAITEGASDYIVKPFSEKVVIEKLERALGIAIRPPSSLA